MLVSPGSPPQQLADDIRQKLILDPDLHHITRDDTKRKRLSMQSGLVRYCNLCKCVKPMRTHHCSVCNRCVLKMDHHCPWVNNCVGFRNHRHFFLFLVYLETGALFFLLVQFAAETDRVFIYSILFEPSVKVSGYLTFASLLCFCVLFAAGAFMLWTFYLMKKNLTTVEFYGAYCGGRRKHGRKTDSKKDSAATLLSLSALSNSPCLRAARQQLQQQEAETRGRNSANGSAAAAAAAQSAASSSFDANNGGGADYADEEEESEQVKELSALDVYDLGFYRNMQQVFGNDLTWYNWFLPTTAPPAGNGLLFDRNDVDPAALYVPLTQVSVAVQTGGESLAQENPSIDKRD